jgi:hypothetical protein
MRAIVIIVMFLSTGALAQSAAPLTPSDSLKQSKSRPFLNQVALGTAQVLGSAAVFVLPIELIMPSFMDSEIVRAAGFWLIPFSFSLGGMLLTTHYFGDLMGGDGQYRMTLLFSGLGYLVFSRGWTTQDTRFKKYLQFSAPIVLGGIAGYWLSSWLLPESERGNITPYVHGSEFGLQVNF